MAEKSRKIVTRFHPTHGENIVLREDSTVAYRTASFANSLAFSEKPLQPGEIFLVEIEKTESGWSGHMRLGLTLIDPASVKNSLPQYAMPNLVKLGNTWIFAITKSYTIWDSFEGIAGTGYGERNLTFLFYQLPFQLTIYYSIRRRYSHEREEAGHRWCKRSNIPWRYTF